MTKCLLVSPRFLGDNYWNYHEVCELIGARYPATPLGLVTVAALLPPEWELRLLDLNVREMDTALIDWADIVITGGMITQQRSLLSLVELCHARGKGIAVGGPDPTSQPETYVGADFLVLDEGEMTIPKFLADLEAGVRHGTYRSAEKADMTKSPAPRFDLLEPTKYLHVGVQSARGCPFNCEFCDVIELYGRKPRTKTPGQVLQELERLYQVGYRGHVDFVDDNFIGNKKKVMALLPELLAWSRERNFPFYFSTEASINLADDPKLLAMMEAVDFRYVFVGIETPDKDLLVRTQKKQNTRHPIVDSIHRLYCHGMVVTAGFIVGFDGETRTAAESIVACVEAAGIPMARVLLLTALPNTQFTRRLAREGRLFEGYSLQPPAEVDQGMGGLNFVPTRPRVEILEDYASIVRHLYSPKSYFDQVLRATGLLRRQSKQLGLRRGRSKELAAFAKLIWRLGFGRETAYYFWRNLFRTLVTRPRNFKAAAHLMACFLHFRRQTLFTVDGIERKIAGLRGEPEETADLRPATSMFTAPPGSPSARC
ncbi:MAG: B12-binding domain-containing radical SAM protein [Deltaproteobacteria bacterium]|nr:B12-binding domain-containing radical SAM protein [Deltaproteobacteria bacterium]